jgi:hypothetical protein
MRKLFLGLGLAVALVSAIAGIPRAAAGGPIHTICTNSGHCSGSGKTCSISAQCGAGQTCICN